MRDLIRKLEEQRSQVFMEIVNERGAVNRDYIFSLVIKLRSINKTLEMIKGGQEVKKSYVG